jgi:hypothetical protein
MVENLNKYITLVEESKKAVSIVYEQAQLMRYFGGKKKVKAF